MPNTLNSVLQKARYMYLELGKRSFYDRNFLYMMFGEEEQNDIYKHQMYKTPNMVICSTLIAQYQSLLKRLCIDCEVKEDSARHSFLLFKDEEGNIHKTDLTRDLKNIQFYCKTSHFGNSTLSADKLRATDIELGYINQKMGYADDCWPLFRERILSSKLDDNQRIELILKGLSLFGDLSKLGKSELFNLYQKFTKYCSDNSRNIHFYSQKNSHNAQEEFFVEFKSNGICTVFKLNLQTCMFEFWKQKEYEEIQL